MGFLPPNSKVLTKITMEIVVANDETRKVDSIVDESNKVLFEADSVFPFQIFPDKIVIDKIRVTIIRKQFLFKRIFPILIEDILGCKVDRGLLFAALSFEIKGYETNPRPVAHLWPEDANKARQYIMGLIKIKRDKVDLSQMLISEVAERLDQMSTPLVEENSLF